MNDSKTDSVDPVETDENVVEHSFEFKPIEYHEWKQEGNMITCSSCPHKHSASVAPGMVLRKVEGNFTLIKEY